MRQLVNLFFIIKYFGVSWLLFRLWYRFKMKTGIIKIRTPVTSWESLDPGRFLINRNFEDPELYYQYRLKRAPEFFIPDKAGKESSSLFQKWDQGSKDPVQSADNISQGIFTYYSYHEFKLGFPPDWFYDPFNNYHYPRNSHWSDIQEFKYTDIKNIWELSRFGFVYRLVRAYYRTGDDQYARIFWKLVENWQRANPPNQGPNWKCGQEIAFRIMAWCFGLYGFKNCNASTPQRLTDVCKMIAVSGIRIESNLSYALSQQNNHSISEAAALYTIGILFPEISKAEHWKKRGKKLLEEFGRQLIYGDGSFVQHSLNYHRLMLQVYLWALRLGDINHDPFSPDIKERLLASCLFLYNMQDHDSGTVPNYGQNDGALILPLNNCGFHDFRPLIQAVYFQLTGKRCFKAGAWDEDLYWFFGESALKAEADNLSQEELQAEEGGGYYTMRSRQSFVFTRCTAFRHRPSQADMLHMDLFWKGQNIAIDPGTYSYHAEDPWNNPFAGTACHNTVSVDGKDQMRRMSKFMWLPWIEGKVLRDQSSPSKRIHLWEAEHNGFQPLKQPVFYQRTILKLGADQWLVLDLLHSQSRHDYRLHWLLAHFPYTYSKKENTVILTTPRGKYYVSSGELSGDTDCTIESADKRSSRGWRAAYYHQKEPALSLCLERNAEEAGFYTFFSPVSSVIKTDSHSIDIEDKNKKISIDLALQEKHSVSEISVQGQYTENWKTG